MADETMEMEEMPGTSQGSPPKKISFYEHKALKFLNEIQLNGRVNAAVFIPAEKRIVTASSDKKCIMWDFERQNTMRKIQSYNLEYVGTCICYKNSKLLIGMLNGAIVVFNYKNGMLHGEYIFDAHLSLIVDIHLTWATKPPRIYSCSIDKGFAFFNLNTSKQMFHLYLESPSCAFEMNISGVIIFLGEHSGLISVINCGIPEPALICSFSGCKGTYCAPVNCLKWNEKLLMLFSVYDQSIIAWKIEKSKGKIMYQLRGHRGMVASFCLAKITDHLISTAENEKLIVWDMKFSRKLTPIQDTRSYHCNNCLKAICPELSGCIRPLVICSYCGKRFCRRCCDNKLPIPEMGLEYSVKCCNICFRHVVTNQVPHAVFCDAQQSVRYVNIDEYTNKLLITVSEGRKIKLWDLSEVLWS